MTHTQYHHVIKLTKIYNNAGGKYSDLSTIVLTISYNVPDRSYVIVSENSVT